EGGDTMTRRRSLAAAFALSAATLTLLVVGAPPALAGGGNSGSAELCRDGGWMNLYGTDGAAFVNQGACVSFAARGGTLSRAHLEPFTIFYYWVGSYPWRVGGIAGTGFAPNTRITFTASSTIPIAQDFLNSRPYVYSDSTGAFTTGFNPYVSQPYLTVTCDPQTVHIVATDGINSVARDTALPGC